MKQGTLAVDKYYIPTSSTMSQGSISPKVVPWEFGVRQGLQVKKIRSSTGYFKKLSAGIIGTVTSISGGTISASTLTTSLYNGGTVANVSLQGATAPSILITGGTFNNGVFGTPLVTGGTVNTGVFGTPNIQGGTLSGTPRITGTVVFTPSASTAALGTNQFSIQTMTGSAVLVANVGGTNFYFQSQGTF